MTGARTTARAVTLVLVAVFAVSLLVSCGSDHGRSSTPTATRGDVDPVSGLPWIREADLPAEARATLALIDRGGPFPFPEKDGSTFGNFEGLLPDRPSGYYHEYTVVTPGSQDRGARRIITGGAGEFYWTEDHYKSFERISRSDT